MADLTRERQKMERDLQSLWISYNDDYKHDDLLQGYDNDLKSKFINAPEDEGLGGPLRTCLQSIKALGFSNKNALKEIATFKSKIQESKGKWSGRKTRKNVARVNVLADEYFNNTQDMLEFVAEMESFVKKARNSCKYIKDETERYFQMKKERVSFSYYPLDQCAGGSSYYSRVREMLKNLNESDVMGESSTKTLREKLKSLYEKQEKMITSLTKQEGKLGKKQDLTSWWRRAKNFIFMGTVASMLVAAIVTTAIGAVPIGGAILTFLPSILGGEHWLGSCVAKYRDSVSYKVDLTGLMLEGARDAKNELAKIKLLIGNLTSEIDSLLLQPSSTKDEGQIDSTMKLIASNLESILKQINELEKETKIFSDEILKARDHVHIRQYSPR